MKLYVQWSKADALLTKRLPWLLYITFYNAQGRGFFG